MKSPSYYVQSLELDIEPNISDIDFGAASLEFEVDDSPEYDDEISALKFETGLELELQCYPNPVQDSEKESEETVGTIDTEVLVLVEGKKEEFEEHIITWEEEGYREIDWDLRYHIESGYITEVLSPMSSIVDNSFRGVLPGFAFTEPPSTESDELPVERTEFLRQYLSQNIREELVNYLDSLDLEYSSEEVEVVVNEIDEIEVDIPEGLENEYDQEEVQDLISRVFTRTVREEAGENIELLSVDVVNVESEEIAD